MADSSDDGQLSRMGPSMNPYLKLCYLWDCIRPKADGDESADDLDQLHVAGTCMRTFSEYVQLRSEPLKVLTQLVGGVSGLGLGKS